MPSFIAFLPSISMMYHALNANGDARVFERPKLTPEILRLSITILFIALEE